MLPRQLNTDEDWAALIAWLQARRLIVHIPIRGPIWFERKRK